jgi:uncharacterized protein YegJ (DUF2314 family)
MINTIKIKKSGISDWMLIIGGTQQTNSMTKMSLH